MKKLIIAFAVILLVSMSMGCTDDDDTFKEYFVTGRYTLNGQFYVQICHKAGSWHVFTIEVLNDDYKALEFYQYLTEEEVESLFVKAENFGVNK